MGLSEDMIAQLSGTITNLGGRWAVIDGAGVGWSITPTFTPEDGSCVTVAVTTTWRESTGPEFWAHDSTVTRDLFEALCAVHGVGPSIAATIVTGLGATALAAAVAAGDASAFRPVRGVGPKLAARIISDVTLPEHITPEDVPVMAGGPNDELAAALAGMGFDAGAAETAVADIRQKQPDADDDEVLASALLTLSA